MKIHKWRKAYVSSPVEAGKAISNLETNNWLVSRKKRRATERMAEDEKRQTMHLQRQLRSAKGMTIKGGIRVSSVNKHATLKITMCQGSNKTFADVITQIAA